MEIMIIAYRNKTYIAADWDEKTGDKDAVDQLHKWNKSEYWGLDFHDAHDLTSSRDSSKSCTIKKSLDERLDNSKHFVLIVGEHTKSLRSGKCTESCDSWSTCSSSYGYGEAKKKYSYIEFECNGAKSRNEYDGKPRVIVLYNSKTVDKTKCLDAVKGIALTHTAMKKSDGCWDYQSVKKAFDLL